MLGMFTLGGAVTDPDDVVDPDPGVTAPAAGGVGRDCEAATLEAATDAARALRFAVSEEVFRGRASPVVEARWPFRVAVDPRGEVASPESLDWLSELAETEEESESEESAEATPTALGPKSVTPSTNAVAPARATRVALDIPLPLLQVDDLELILNLAASQGIGQSIDTFVSNCVATHSQLIPNKGTS